MRIGVLSVQGDVRENVLALRAALEAEGAGGGAYGVRTPGDIAGADALVIPGGESTAIGRMMEAGGLADAVRDRIAGGMPVLGICAGMILLSRGVRDRVTGQTGQPLLGGLDVTIERNSFGRQRESFEADVQMGPLGIDSFRGVFIRAPSVSETGPGAEALAELDGRTVAARSGAVIGTAFHPELAGDPSVHRHLVRSARG